jgi:hypothetical protein
MSGAAVLSDRPQRSFCAMLRTKNGYFRSSMGERLIDARSSTACYNCLLTQRPYGPDGMPANADYCGPQRSCFKPET